MTLTMRNENRRRANAAKWLELGGRRPGNRWRTAGRSVTLRDASQRGRGRRRPFAREKWKTRTSAHTPAIFNFCQLLVRLAASAKRFGREDSHLSIVPLFFSEHQILMKCKVSAATLPRSTPCYSSPSPPMMGRDENWSRRKENVFTTGVVWHKFVAFFEGFFFFYFEGGKTCCHWNKNSFIPEHL